MPSVSSVGGGGYVLRLYMLILSISTANWKWKDIREKMNLV